MMHTALCSGGRRLEVKFERGNFFTVLQGRLEAEASCFLAGDDLLRSATMVRAESPAEPGECDAGIRSRVETARSRRPVHCWTIAKLPDDRRLVLVEFVRQEKDALASIVLTERQRMIFADYPAVFRGKGDDLWRAGDGGTLTAQGFQIVFVLQRGSSYTLGINWMGEEGASLAVFESHGGDRFVEATKEYRYLIH